MIIRAGAVVTMDGPPIAGGVVRVEGERIVEIGQSASADDEIIDLREYILLPGLINAHCHLDYTVLREGIPRTSSFSDWIRAINAEKARLTAEDYVKSIDAGFAEALRFGTTSLLNLEAFPELIVRCAEKSVRTWWCAELIDVGAPQDAERIVSAAVEEFAARMARRVRWKRALSGEGGLAPHALFTASSEVYRRCDEIASANNWILTTHLAESREEMEMFGDGSGRLFDFLKSLGRDMSDCGGVTPLARFLQTAGDANWILAHVNELGAGDLALLAPRSAQFSIAHCPRSHAYFGHRAFAFDRLREIGLNICLATDSLASNDDLSLLAEVRAFRKLHPHVSAATALEMVTVNPANALAASAWLGRIRAGFAADMIALPMSGSADVYEQIVVFENEIPWVMARGEVVVG